MATCLVAEMSLDLESGYRLTAELLHGHAPFRVGPWLVAAQFKQPGGSASRGIALSELASPDYWGRCTDGSLALMEHAGKGKRDPDASRYKLSPDEAEVLWAFIREHVDGLAPLGPRSRPSALAARG